MKYQKPSFFSWKFATIDILTYPSPLFQKRHYFTWNKFYNNFRHDWPTDESNEAREIWNCEKCLEVKFFQLFGNNVLEMFGEKWKCAVPYGIVCHRIVPKYQRFKASCEYETQWNSLWPLVNFIIFFFRYWLSEETPVAGDFGYKRSWTRRTGNSKIPKF